jgi:hypothetical protein
MTTKLIATTKKLAQMDPQDEAVAGTVAELEAVCQQLGEQEREAEKGSFGQQSMKDDMTFIGEQIDKLHAAAIRPAANYARVVSILGGLKRATMAAQRPQNAEIRPRVADAVRKVAGIFAEIDTVQDLDKPLEAIEKAVHGLYGDQSKNSTFYLERRGKGHHSK